MRSYLTAIFLLLNLLGFAQGEELIRPKFPPHVAISSIDTGWYLGASYGVTVWGENSTCACNTQSFEVNAGYEWYRGLGVGMSLQSFQTIWQVISIQGDFSYFPSVGGGSNRNLGVAFGGGVPIRLNTIGGDIEDYSGMTRYYEVRIRGRLGKRADTRVVLAAGVSTLSENYLIDNNWDRIIGGTRTDMRHSGLRVRLGIVW